MSEKDKSNIEFCAVVAYNSGYESGLRFAMRKVFQSTAADDPIGEAIKAIDKELKSLGAME